MSAVTLKRWTREEYERLVGTGILSPEERLELLEGDLVRMWPQNPAHALAIRNVEEALRDVFRSGFDVRVQLPFNAGDASEPEPDVAVVRGHRRDFFQFHPSTATLLVEVSDSTLDYDRRRKGLTYARANVLDYWIVNLVDHLVEVYRDPAAVQGYMTVRKFRQGDTIAPLAAPSVSIEVNDLLP